LATPSLVTPSQAQPASLVEIGTQGWIFPVWDHLGAVEPNNLRTSSQLLAEIITILRSGRMEVVFVLLPSRKRLMRQFLPPGATFNSAVERRYTVPMADARQAGAVVPDLSTRFQEVLTREPGRQLFFKTDTHWTPVGAEIAAVEVARVMRENWRLPPSPRPGTRLGDLRRTVVPQGDLVGLLPAAQRAQFGPEESLLREVLQPEGSAVLLDDDVADVALVGNSFLMPRLGFQPVLSNQISRPVSLFWRANNMGPFGILLQYLRSDSFRQQRPRTIVWAFLEPEVMTSPSWQSWGQAAMPTAAYLAELRRVVA
jgi:alginate O-acetyltransferase complex protein AlgJ